MTPLYLVKYSLIIQKIPGQRKWKTVKQQTRLAKCVSRYYICTRFMIETLFHRTDLFYL